jgi:hypothetical protein
MPAMKTYGAVAIGAPNLSRIRIKRFGNGSPLPIANPLVVSDDEGAFDFAFVHSIFYTAFGDSILALMVAGRSPIGPGFPERRSWTGPAPCGGG